MGAYYTGHSHQAAMGPGGGAGAPTSESCPLRAVGPRPQVNSFAFYSFTKCHNRDSLCLHTPQPGYGPGIIYVNFDLSFKLGPKVGQCIIHKCVLY